MKLSTKGRYGLRALVDLAVYSNGDHVSLSSIAERENISENYLEQVFSTLRKAGIVKSVKGAQGGYLLAKSPEFISVGTILRALEGDLSVVDEKSEAEGMVENSIRYCIKTLVWDKMTESLNKVADSITLEMLANEYKNMNRSMQMMYYI